MPIYDYRCTHCGEFRKIRPMSESRSPQPCPDCGEASQRLLSAPFLAGDDQPRRPGGAQPGSGRVPWRTACGLGCSHSH